MKISIITATFNSGQTVRDTIESVLRQTYTDFEYIIKDGGSKDDTLEIVKEYAPQFGDRLKVVSEPDKGIYDAMNIGLSMATGDVVGFLNSDDFYSDYMRLEEIAKAFKMNPKIDAITANTRDVTPDLSKTVRYTRSAYYRRWMTHLGYVPSHPSFYVKRACYEKWGVFNTAYKIAADTELMARFFYLHQLVYKYVNMEIVTMRVGGTSMQSRRTNTEEIYRALKNLGIYTNKLLLLLRYVLKIPELINLK